MAQSADTVELYEDNGATVLMFNFRTREKNSLSLQGFSDVVVYVRVERADGLSCLLLASRSRVAPVKTLTIPRLEL